MSIISLMWYTTIKLVTKSVCNSATFALVNCELNPFIISLVNTFCEFVNKFLYLFPFQSIFTFNQQALFLILTKNKTAMSFKNNKKNFLQT